MKGGFCCEIKYLMHVENQFYRLKKLKTLFWTKNDKREHGDAWAYMEFNIGDVFYLNWPRGRADMGKTDAGKPKINELILLFQTVNRNTGSKAGTYLTHIVTPIEASVTVDEGSTHPYKRLISVIAKNAEPIPKPATLTFMQPNRGWLFTLDLIKTFDKLNMVLSFQDKQNYYGTYSKARI
jgi:hypothetical protein